MKTTYDSVVHWLRRLSANPEKLTSVQFQSEKVVVFFASLWIFYVFIVFIKNIVLARNTKLDYSHTTLENIIGKGANVNDVDKFGRTALDVAFESKENEGKLKKSNSISNHPTLFYFVFYIRFKSSRRSNTYTKTIRSRAWR